MIFEEVTNCPLCDRDRHYHKYHVTGKMHKCIDGNDEIIYLICECGFIFQIFKMTQETLEEYYNGPYREYCGTAEVTASNVIEQLVRANKVVGFLYNEIEPNDALDIGSSTGWVLKAFRDIYGCQVIGIELSDKFREYSRKLGVDALRDIKHLKRNRKFDLITILQTLEHFNEPLVLLKKVRKLITEDGTLAIEVPLVRQGVAHNAYRLAHPVAFTKETFEMILNKAGFAIEKEILTDKNILVKAYCEAS